MANNLPLDLIVNVSVSVAAQQATAPTFNQGCVIGNSARIPTVGANSRIRPYPSAAAMLLDGYQTTDPEYLAAQLYFSQSPAPSTLFVGAQNPTAVNTVVVTPSAQGTGYLVGDVLTATGSGATVSVTTIGGSGAVTAVTLIQGGTGASVGNGIATTGGTGTGAQVNITAIGESAVTAANACRNAAQQWYAFMLCNAVDADHLALAAFAQSAQPQTVYFATTPDTNVLGDATNNLLDQLQTLSYNRVETIYSTTQSGLFLNNAFAAAAVMGMSMGLNTGLANSYFTQKFKALTGVAPEPLTLAQATEIEGANGNLLVTYPGYIFFEQGTMANGQFFDQILGVDMLASDIQIEVTNTLAAMNAVPQTDAGQALLIAAANRACAKSANRGFIASGTWNGPAVLNLQTGTPLPSGYLVQSPSYTTQTTADRRARKSMPIFVTVTEAGSAHSVQVQVNIQA